mgnify:CR=1 FL=1
MRPVVAPFATQVIQKDCKYAVYPITSAIAITIAIDITIDIIIVTHGRRKEAYERHAQAQSQDRHHS